MQARLQPRIDAACRAAEDEVVVDADGPVFTVEVHERVRRFMAEPMALALKYSQQMEELQGQTMCTAPRLCSKPVRAERRP